MKAAQPVNPQQSTALGLNLRKVKIQQIVPSRGVAICVDSYNHTTEIPYRVQPGKGRIPQEGEVWYIDRTLGTLWSFRAFVAADDTAFTTMEDQFTFSKGIILPNGQQILVGTVPTSVTATIGLRRTSPSDPILAAGVTGDTSSRFALYSDGLMQWGPGGSTARDTTLYRSAANVLSTDDSLTIGGTLTKALQTWQTPTLTSGYTNGDQGGSSHGIQYRIDAEDNVVIIGACHANTASPGATLFTLGAGFRPAAQWRISTNTNHGGTYASASVIVAASGVVTIDPAPTLSTTDVYLDLRLPLGNIA